MIYGIASNLIQRSFSDMHPSEKAAVLSIQYSKLFSPGKRNDIINELNELNALSNPHDTNKNSTSPQIGAKLRTDEKIGDNYGLSKNTVARYLRISQLAEPLKRMLDNNQVSFIPAVTLSFLSDNEQELVCKCIELNEFKVDIKKAELLCSYSERGKLDEDNAYHILSGEKSRKPRVKAVPYTMKKKNLCQRFLSLTET